jgi:hypothetical protein
MKDLQKVNLPKNIETGKYPEMILDDLCVRHAKEVPLEMEYELFPCACGIKHLETSDTWCHGTIAHNSDGSLIGIYRFCKMCMEPLFRKKKKNKDD